MNSNMRRYKAAHIFYQHSSQIIIVTVFIGATILICILFVVVMYLECVTELQTTRYIFQRAIPNFNRIVM